jgi:uncharacterized protein (DUF433 family)
MRMTGIATDTTELDDEVEDVSWRALIVDDPGVLCGKPTIAGTRISVELILDLLAAGTTAEQLLRDYPHLKPEQVRAALAFARSCVVDHFEQARHTLPTSTEAGA